MLCFLFPLYLTTFAQFAAAMASNAMVAALVFTGEYHLIFLLFLIESHVFRRLFLIRYRFVSFAKLYCPRLLINLVVL